MKKINYFNNKCKNYVKKMINIFKLYKIIRKDIKKWENRLKIKRYKKINFFKIKRDFALSMKLSIYETNLKIFKYTNRYLMLYLNI